MVDLLRDPVWNGIAAIAAIIALILAVQQEKRVANTLPKILIVVGRAIIGILIIALGPSVQWCMEKLFAGGIPLVIKAWQSLGVSQLWNTFALASLVYAVFPGTVTAVIASPKSQNTILRTSIAAFITLSISDIFLIILDNLRAGFFLTIKSFLFSFLLNAVGGFLVAIIIVYLVELYDKAFEKFYR